jgi:hypothetical protein
MSVGSCLWGVETGSSGSHEKCKFTAPARLQALCLGLQIMLLALPFGSGRCGASLRTELTDCIVRPPTGFIDRVVYRQFALHMRGTDMFTLFRQLRLLQEWRAGKDDIASLLFDALCAIPAVEGTTERLSSWCGAAEAGSVRAAPLPNEGTKARKKRKFLELSEGEQESAVGGRVLWSSVKAQRRAFRCVNIMPRLYAMQCVDHRFFGRYRLVGEGRTHCCLAQKRVRQTVLACLLSRVHLTR